jgi:hypothetical protein
MIKIHFNANIKIETGLLEEMSKLLYLFEVNRVKYSIKNFSPKYNAPQIKTFCKLSFAVRRKI